MTVSPSYPAPGSRRRVMVLAMLLTAALHVVAYFGYLRLSAVTLPPGDIVLSAHLIPFVPPKAPAKPHRAKPASAPPPQIAVAPQGAIHFAPLAAIEIPATPGSTTPGNSTPTAIAGQFAAVPQARLTWPELPSQVAVSLQVSSMLNGEAEMLWKRDGTHYETSTTVRANNPLITLLAGSLRQVSRGEITRAGLRPEVFTMARGRGEPESAEFLADSNELRTKSRGDTRVAPLPPGLQDMQSFLFQMGIDANRFDSADARVKVTATNVRKVYQYTFRRVADETLALPTGALLVWHLVAETTDPDDTYEVWLAPELHHLPVKLKFRQSGYVVDLTATAIRSSAD